MLRSRFLKDGGVMITLSLNSINDRPHFFRYEKKDKAKLIWFVFFEMCLLLIHILSALFL